MAKAKRYTKVDRVIVAGSSDKHSGCIYGLMNPEVVLYDNNPETGQVEPWSPTSTASQRVVWMAHQEDFGQIVDLADGSPIIAIDMGDMTHGNKWMRELVSTRPSDQWLIAAENLRPWLRLPNLRAMRLVTGTGVHEFGEGSSARLLAEMLKREFKKDVLPVDHELLTINGVPFDLSHHGAPPGIRSWLKGNVLELYTRSIMLDAIQRHHRPPQVLWRAHYHQYVRRTATVGLDGSEFDCVAVILPACCLLDDHSRKVGRSPAAVSLGMVAAEIIDGKLHKHHAFWREIDMRTKEVIDVHEDAA